MKNECNKTVGMLTISTFFDINEVLESDNSLMQDVLQTEERTR